jgi:DNA-binding CsgD family transcriptional regulator/energy-coupling factor transporter ATP-binding protein EcfA2
VGRADLLNAARGSLAAGESVLIAGPAGIGKSTVLSALAAEQNGLLLRASAAEVESGLPYLTLVDLFGSALAEHGAALPGHLRAALDAALLRTAAPCTPQDELAVRLAVLELLRILAAEAPVLLVIDDLQWVDEPSAGVLRFVSRRVPDLAVSLLGAERVSAPGQQPRCVDLCPPPHVEVPVDPLAEAELAELLAERFGGRLSRVLVDRLHLASGGNPLFAVELGRALVERGEPGALPASSAEPLPVPHRLRELVSARLAALPSLPGEPLLLLAAAARPSRALLVRAGIDPGVGLADAISAGVVETDREGGVRFSHPLMREMVYADAEPAARAAAHERLAATVDDPVERARHLAMARSDPDEALASTLVEAAAVARHRGAPLVAADLARLAADRTVEPGRAGEYRLHSARHAYAGGAATEAHLLANAALRDATNSTVRVAARLLLVDLAGQDQSGVGPLLDAAFADAGSNQGLVAQVRLKRGSKMFYDGDTESALAELKRAEQAAEHAGNAECLVEVLALRGAIEAPFNVPGGEEIMERVANLSRGLPVSRAVVHARQLTTVSCLQRGDVAEAVRRIEALRIAVERSGTVYDLANVLVTVASVYSRAGRCADALAAGRYCLRLFTDVAAGAPGPGLLVGALVELAAGQLSRAEQHAAQAVAASRAAGDGDWLKGAYAVQGQIHLLAGDPVAAVEPMRVAYQMEQRRGPVDPSNFLWHGDFVEALAASGARAEAGAVLAQVRGQAQRLDRWVVELGLTRAGAVLAAYEGEPRAGVAALTEALHRWTEHPYPVEVARAWHALGGLERRAHRRGAARDALTEAAGRYAALGAAPWLTAAQAELARLDGAREAGLSVTERRIVDLVRRGATNREIARATFLSIKAVEANLTRLYRRFGVRNREQLGRALADEP